MDDNQEYDAEVLALLYADAVRSVENQWGRLSEIRSRAATLLTAASITAAFLAPRAFNDDMTKLAWLGVAAFAGVAAAATMVLWPWPGWRLARHPWNLLRDYSDRRSIDVLYDLTYHLGQDNSTNEERIGRLSRFVAAGCVSLAAEVVLFLLDLGFRR